MFVLFHFFFHSFFRDSVAIHAVLSFCAESKIEEMESGFHFIISQKEICRDNTQTILFLEMKEKKKKKNSEYRKQMLLVGNLFSTLRDGNSMIYCGSCMATRPRLLYITEKRDTIWKATREGGLHFSFSIFIVYTLLFAANWLIRIFFVCFLLFFWRSLHIDITAFEICAFNVFLVFLLQFLLV